LPKNVYVLGALGNFLILYCQLKFYFYLTKDGMDIQKLRVVLSRFTVETNQSSGLLKSYPRAKLLVESKISLGWGNYFFEFIKSFQWICAVYIQRNCIFGKQIKNGDKTKQAGAELCQAQAKLCQPIEAEHQTILHWAHLPWKSSFRYWQLFWVLPV
jgi:hypothetical protein